MSMLSILARFTPTPFSIKTCCLTASLLLAACQPNTSGNELNTELSTQPSQPTSYTRAILEHAYQTLPMSNQQDFIEARRGLIAAATDLNIAGSNGSIWNLNDYAFLQQPTSDTAHPSLWRQAQLNNLAGLYEVVPNIYQVRGFDLANMTLIKGQQGWIVVDPLTSNETARAAFDFAMQHLAERHGINNISAIMFTHSHIDHFGGVGGLIEAGYTDANLMVVAPSGFMEEATSENILVGNAMSRRATYMYGKPLPKSPVGHIDSALGKAPAFGNFSIAQPTHSIEKTGQSLLIDGVEFQFQITPDSEAPAEFTFYLPEYKAFCGGEIINRTMHNLYTLRGAKVRDALAWSGYIEEARNLFAEADVFLGVHHWPMWGRDSIQTFLKGQRDTYKFIHDQTVRRMNQGMTPNAIADDLVLPESLASNFNNRGLYGTLKHNAKAVYQHYLGWYDANPAHLDPLPNIERARGYVKLAGGEHNLYQTALMAYQNGEYRWAAELLNHLVFANPKHQNARLLLANTYDQLGYQSESSAWRDAYLTGALELRHGVNKAGINLASMRDILKATPLENFFMSMAVRLKAEDAADKDWRIIIKFSDLDERYTLWIENSVLHHAKISAEQERALSVNASLTISHDFFIRMLIGELGLKETILSDDLTVTGNRLTLMRFLGLFEKPDPSFALITPLN